ncbi:MAG: 3-isopropylmalate dehydratase large subunit [Candidatus Omnitrophica bacterium CG1_02_44_16]|nr:MAG: 3-isopropylmalate dehydratase large subunit [Candidatus Omnitrophica bacterium CG1_02_44_16]PIY82796.1 MAG: 3-isopropylmalate dehydratase large subunit [Candidatus Omnitrophica bacterium CG_4_10_14_0_8_um_filter_44_12]PIZ84043.1 MAG: 3-isopropylmalate dehydratase large subunit [Candidatus Omnitrophica bacterium CG_4_10_14_0_2_um_filter_44_9]
MGKTIAEKILSLHAGQDLKAGDFAVCSMDFCFGQDGTSGIIVDRFKALGVKEAVSKDKFAIVIDHSAPSPNMGVSAVHKKLRDFAKEKGLLLYDVGCGVCHQIIPEKGHVLPGDLVLGADSHTCTYGALGALSTGVGSTDLAISLACGKNWFKVPESIKIIVKGKLPRGVYSKDIILHIIGDLRADGATYKSIEFYGEAIDSLSMDARFTICNMGVEMGAKFGMIPADNVTLKWVAGRNKIRKPAAQYADKDAIYSLIREYDISKISPQLAKPHTVDNNAHVEDAAGARIDEAYLGTCTNGRLEDLTIAASILKGKKVSPNVRFIVAPASKDIYLTAIKNGIINVLVEAGGSVVTPGCGPCVGTHNGVPSVGEVVISSANRNFKGRMGNPDAFVYLASPATVAASALEGRIADPRRYL